MALGNVIDWEILRDNYLSNDVPLEHPILEEPELRLIFDVNPKRLGVRLGVESAAEWAWNRQLRNVTVRRVMIEGKAYVEALTDSPTLFRSIYALVGDLVRRVGEGERNCLRLLEVCLADFGALAARQIEVARERALGLYGELYVLKSLIEARVGRVNSWIGPLNEVHDFRIDHRELEVKTTASSVREHIVHGQNQLCPSPGCELHIVSLRLGLAGSGEGCSVDDLVTSLRASLSKTSADQARFEQLLRELGYAAGHIECSVPYKLVAPVQDIVIGRDFPEFGPSQITSAFGIESAGRVRDLRIQINLEGLGCEFAPEEWKR